MRSGHLWHKSSLAMAAYSAGVRWSQVTRRCCRSGPGGAAGLCVPSDQQPLGPPVLFLPHVFRTRSGASGRATCGTDQAWRWLSTRLVLGSHKSPAPTRATLHSGRRATRRSSSLMEITKFTVLAIRSVQRTFKINLTCAHRSFHLAPYAARLSS